MAAHKNNRYNAKYTEADIQKISDKILDWALNTSEIYIASFIYRNYKKNKSWLHNLGRTYPLMKETLETVTQLIATKIANHCFEGDKNSTFGEKILPMYCSEYKELLKWKAEIQKQQIQEPENKCTFNTWAQQQKNGSNTDTENKPS